MKQENMHYNKNKYNKIIETDTELIQMLKLADKH